MPRLSRRDFLNGVAVSSVVGTMTGLVPGSAQALSSVGANPVLLNKRSGQVKYHTCLRNCADRCLMKFRVQDGRMTYVTGAEEQIKTSTCPCVKGLAYVEYTYAPDRILHPMVRVGEKGSGKWRRITWDEAWELLVKKTKETIEKYGSEAILPYSYSGNYGAIGMRGADRFFNRVGASYLDRLVCTEAGVWGYGLTTGATDGPDPESVVDADCYVSWGFNETVSNVHQIKFVNIARDRGCKVVAINPNRTPICSQADVYLQPKPSTDAYVASGIMKYLLANDMVDWNFMENHTVGHKEVIARLEEISWDEIVKTTGLAQADIEEAAKIIGEAKRLFTRGGYGMQRNYNGARMTRAIALIHAMRGMYGKPSTGILYDNVRGIVNMNLKKGRGNGFIREGIQHVNMTDLDQALKAPNENPTSQNILSNGTTPPQPIKPIHMFFFYNGNPIAVSPNTVQLEKNLKRDDLFVVGFDMVMTDSMELCDMILPASTQFETDDIISDYSGWYVQICEKVIEPVGESKPNWEFFAEWGRRMGFTEPEFKQSTLEVAADFFDIDHKKAPFYKGITLERLQKEKFIKFNYPEAVPAWENKCATPSGKIEMYSQGIKDAGLDPTIDLRLCEADMEEKERKLPFRMLSPGIPQRVNSSFYNVKYIRPFNAYECQINPEDAKRLGIKQGDRVRLTNHRGEAFFGARVTTRVPVGTVQTIKCNWRRMNPYGNKTSTNCLTTSRMTDMGGCSAYHSTRVDLQKA